MDLKTKQDLEQLLGKLGACAPAMEYVEASKLKTARGIYDSCERGDWIGWLLRELGLSLTGAALAEYEKVRAQILKRLVPWLVIAESGVSRT